MFGWRKPRATLGITILLVLALTGLLDLYDYGRIQGSANNRYVQQYEALRESDIVKFHTFISILFHDVFIVFVVNRCYMKLNIVIYNAWLDFQ